MPDTKHKCNKYDVHDKNGIMYKMYKKMLCCIIIIIIITIVNVTYKLICQIIMSDHRIETV